MDELDIIRSELDQAAKVLAEFSSNTERLRQIEAAATIVAGSISSGGKVLSIGNGGSHCDAMHFTEELVGNFREERKPLPAICISEPGFITCAANDFGFEQVFSRAVEGLGRKGDVLLAISTSGNSPNIVNAAQTAKASGLHVIALTGKDGGKLSKACDIEINVPHSGYSDRIQEVHIKIIHILILLIEKQVR